MGRVQTFMLILSRVGLSHFSCWSGWIRSRKLDSRAHVQLCNRLADDDDGDDEWWWWRYCFCARFNTGLWALSDRMCCGTQQTRSAARPRQQLRIDVFLHAQRRSYPSHFPLLLRSVFPVFRYNQILFCKSRTCDLASYSWLRKVFRSCVDQESDFCLHFFHF